jgi:hypothetical protein
VTAADLHPKHRLVTEMFPVTILFGLQYGALVIFPAVMHDTQPLSLILTLCAVGIGTAFLVEAIRCPLGSRNAKPIAVSAKAAMAIVVVGWLATIGGSVSGGIAYLNQTTSARPSHLTAIFTPLTSWVTIGTALVMAQAASGMASRVRAWWVILIGFGLELVLGLRDAVLGDAVSYFLVVTFLAVVLGFIRWRWVVIALFTIPVVLPVLYNFKTQERSNFTQVAEPGQQPEYGQRLRLDLEMAQVKDFPKIPASSVNPPSLPTLLLFGLVPRIFDQSRGSLNTGQRLSVAVGGTPTNSDTATSFGDAYIVDGWTGVILYSGLASVVTGIVIRRRGPWAYALLGVIAQSCLLVEQSYPDMLASLLQGGVSLAIAIALVRVLRRGPSGQQQGAVNEDGSGSAAFAASGGSCLANQSSEMVLARQGGVLLRWASGPIRR